MERLDLTTNHGLHIGNPKDHETIEAMVKKNVIRIDINGNIQLTKLGQQAIEDMPPPDLEGARIKGLILATTRIIVDRQQRQMGF